MSSIPTAEPLPIALRAYLLPSEKKRKSYAYNKAEPSEWSLVFDVETTTDTAQHRRLIPYQARKGDELREQGIAYEPSMLSRAEVELLADFARQRGALVRPFDEFIERVFVPVSYELGGYCIGFNLPFDLSRLAIAHAHARKQFKGGFTFQLSPNNRRPRVRVKHLNARSALVQFAVPAGRSPEQRARERGAAVDHHHGHFCDLKSLGSALTGRSHSLASLARLLDTPHQKLATSEHGGPLTPEYLEYALNDVQATWECFETLRARYDSYRLTRTPLTRVRSEASIGKASLVEMGIEPWTRLQSDFPPELIGIILGTYFGGRAAVRLRGQVARVLYCDFLSMYPTVCALLGLWDYVRAERIAYEDVTDEIRGLLAHLSRDDLRRPEFWRSLQVLVQIEPDADLLPTRGDYVGDGQYAIGLNYRSGGQPVWLTLADILVSTLRTGRPPRMLKALRFRPVGIQKALRPLDLLGNSTYRVDPRSEDVYTRLIDLRNHIKRKKRQADIEGDCALAERLDSEQLALKIMANAVSYGIFVELNVHELDRREQRTSFGPDGRAFTTLVNRVEQPGRYFHPLLATLTTGAARLMLALSESLIESEGLSWLFCDTDSMAIAKPTEMAEDDFIERAQRVCDWFTPLNPYRDKQPLFRIEDINYRLDANGSSTDELEPLYGIAISAKRHALFNLGDSGRPAIRKASAHGLGHLDAPYQEDEAPGTIPASRVPLRELGVERWQHDIWYRIAEALLKGEPLPRLGDLPAFERPAMMRYAATTRAITDWFRTYNADKPYNQQLRPFGFFSVPLIARDGYPAGTNPQQFLLFAPFTADAREAASRTYTNAHSKEIGEYEISTSIRAAHVARAQSYHELILEYATHPEPKSLGHDGRPCGRDTTGLLSPRHIDGFHVEAIGKESNRVEEHGLVNADDVYLRYQDAVSNMWTTHVLPVLRDFGRSEIARLSGLTTRTLGELLAERSHPHEDNLRLLTATAAVLARKRLRTWDIPPHRNDLACLHRYLSERTHRRSTNKCRNCGRSAKGNRTLCDACKQKAYRNRQSSKHDPRASPLPDLSVKKATPTRQAATEEAR